MTEPITYHSLPPEFQAYLHALELREYYRTTLKICDNDKQLALQLTNKRLFNSNTLYWEHILPDFLQRFQNRRNQRLQLIPYYILAGCGIKRTTELLKVGQERVYKVREQLESQTYNYDKSTIPVFLQEPERVKQLQKMLQDVNVMDGYRVLDPKTYSHNSFHPNK